MPRVTRKKSPSTNGHAKPKGLTFRRVFSRDGVHPFDEVEWEKRRAEIKDDKGKIVFEQDDVEFPKSWSQQATNIVASKYFYGERNTPERESSVKELVGRVTGTITRWGKEDGYFAADADAVAFADDLTWLCLNQHGSFNSPVWFNVGVTSKASEGYVYDAKIGGVRGVEPGEHRPQGSACQPYGARVVTERGLIPIGRIVADDMVGLRVHDGDDWATVVATKANGRKDVFRVTLSDGNSVEATADHLVRVRRSRSPGSCGSWSRVDSLRVGSVLEVHAHATARVHAGVSFGDGDATSFGGHGDLTADTDAVSDDVAISEAALAGWLQTDGFVGQYDGTNRSLTVEFVTINDDERSWVERHLAVVFPDAHRHDSEEPTDDPNVDFRRIRFYGENLRPFVEKYGLLARNPNMDVPAAIFEAPDDVVAAYLRSVFQADGYVSFKEAGAKVGVSKCSRRMMRGVQLLLARLGVYSRLLRKRERRSDRNDQWEVSIGILSEREAFCDRIGFVGSRKQSKLYESLGLIGRRCRDVRLQEVVSIEPIGEMDVYDIQTTSEKYLSEFVLVHNCFIQSVDDTMESIMELARSEAMLFKGGSGTGTDLSTLRSSREKLAGGGKPSGPVSFMRVYDAIAGVVKSGGKTRRAAKLQTLKVWHPDIIDFIECKRKEEKKAHALIRQGYEANFNGEAYSSVMFQNANISVRATDEFLRAVEQDGDWTTRAVTTGEPVDTIRAAVIMDKIADGTWHCGDPGMQYEDTIQRWHTCPNTAPINSANPCAEFNFLDDTACNLASLNLMRFRREDGSFDVERFRAAVRVFIVAQEILVDRCSYPTARIALNSHRFRPLGLGYANLGALLMASGLPYDSDEGRAMAAAITAIMHGQANLTSSEVASKIGPFDGFAENSEPMLRVMRMHRDAIKDRAIYATDDLVDAAHDIWIDVVNDGDEHGFRNAQVTVIAPTGCATPDTLVLTDRGLRRLGVLGDQNGKRWQDVDFSVQTDDGPKRATKFFVNGTANVVRLETATGSEFRATPEHRLKVVGRDGSWRWRRMGDISDGDIVPVKLGGMIGDPLSVPLPPLEELDPRATEFTVPAEMNRDLAELVGAFMANGSLHNKGIRISVRGIDRTLAARTADLFMSVFGLESTTNDEGPDVVSVVVNSVPLRRWWAEAGFAKIPPASGRPGKGHKAHVPDAILATNDPIVYAAFIRGVIDHDGTVACGCPEFMGTNRRFISDLRTMALALGFPTKLRSTECGISKKRLWRARLLNRSYNPRWSELIGFTEDRKTNALGDLVQVGKGDIIPVPHDVIDRVCPIGHDARHAACLAVRRTSGITREMAARLYRETGDAELGHLLGFFYDRVKSTTLLDDPEMTLDISVPENVTYVANGFVSHNTIAFMMDCDTTGLEPDIALVKYKNLAGRGVMKIVNRTVPMALAAFGYDNATIARISAHIDANDTIEGAPGLKDEHLPIFDCAFRPENGKRSIRWQGHVEMLAAIQPFLSGSSSKTCNMPRESTVADIRDAYLLGWKLGLKCIAIYRDGSKESQPLNTKAEGDGKPTVPQAAPARTRMPETRDSVTHKFDIQGHKGYMTVGLFDDGRPGELFVTMAKEGSTIAGLMDTIGTTVSMGLQYGVPLEVFVHKFAHSRFEPSGFTKNADIPIAKSIVDYIFRWLGMRFVPGYREANAPRREEATGEAKDEPAPAPKAKAQTDTPLCPNCGTLTIRAGTCGTCPACGETTGCS